MGQRPSPQLTAADLPVERQAQEVVTMLVERLRDPDAPLRQLVLAPGLTVRGSSGPAPGRHPAGAEDAAQIARDDTAGLINASLPLLFLASRAASPA
jgi:Periplasmic binding protein-like domain